ncbi:efflux RND transporter periplasmic adaptor subunit [Defluviimonas sp. WL0002]|uniref:Efflux RND transporter periplasmic adaptor subunit n=1 Tax=Albidovulum marisflavi TaxID=2984159 RepID=A0ABT2ZGJ6_9RHOB|nr:efflux RND transporter periplasmic adaptor subunit [Defluviimonas sp. WL0002]MCV2870268.1 efflux RND transporter periplasmic adaptor subunit [Defluviimonas sp. WL0002]
MVRLTFGLCAALIAAPAATLAQGAGGGQPQPVTVVTLDTQSVTLKSPLPGRVAASGVAEVRPQVNGIITERLFEEGGEVQKGDPLYQIDPASYEATVAAAEAALAQAEASLRAAESEATRQETLLGRSVVSQQNLDDAIAARDVADAAVKVARANLMSAQIDLDRTTIRAPLSGVVGLSETTQGALVTAGQATALTVIRDLDPVYVDVTQSAAELLRWRRSDASVNGADQTVTLRLADGSQYEETGRLEAAEPHVNELTGVVVLRLEFPNPDHLLLPGMYVQVEMPQGVVENVVLAPQEGVSRDRRGLPTAMVVNADNLVERRQLTVLRDQGASWIVTEGLGSGDRLIVEGLQKIAPGATVVPEERGSSTPPEAAAETSN